MNLKMYQEAVARTWNDEPHPDAQLSNACMGLAGESGELIDIIKKVIYHGHPSDAEMKNKLRKEIGDVFYYAACLCNLYNWNADVILDENVEKLRKRFPNGFSTKASIERADKK